MMTSRYRQQCCEKTAVVTTVLYRVHSMGDLMTQVSFCVAEVEESYGLVK